MLDVLLFRDPEGLQLVKKSQETRFQDTDIVDKVVQLDTQWRDTREALNQTQKVRNKLNKDIGAFHKNKQTPPPELVAQKKEVEDEIQVLTEKEVQFIKERDQTIAKIGNIVHDSVPVFNDEEHNEQVDKWGEFNREDWMLSHYDLVQMAGLADSEKGAAVAGSRGYFLTGMGVMLNQALISYAMRFLSSRKYTLLQTPFVMNQSLMGKVAQLDDFDEQLYKVTGASEDQYLIATSEQPICAFHKDSWMEKSDLPRRIAGYSICFRKEAGSHGRDQLGIFRVHQFEKVEQFFVTSPEGDASWDAQEEMIEASKEFYKSLRIPFHVVNIVSGELNDAAAKKYDLEAWFPGSNALRELVSCSNCTDYQSRRLEVRYGSQKTGDGKKQYVHMLNSTLIATERAMCCVVENYQTKTGIRVPEVLQQYMGGVDFIPFVRAPPAVKKGQAPHVQHVPTPSELEQYTTSPESPNDDEAKSQLQAYMDSILPQLNEALNTLARDRPADPLKALSTILAESTAQASMPAAQTAEAAPSKSDATPAKKEEPPPTADTLLELEGLTSQADADTLEQALCATDGVISASVEFEAKRAKIVGAPGYPTEAQLVAVCEGEGFKAEPKRLAGGLFKYDPNEVDINGGNATADDFLDAFGF